METIDSTPPYANQLGKLSRTKQELLVTKGSHRMGISSHVNSAEYSQLKSDEVHIWSASLLGGERDIAYFLSILSEDERERAKSFRFSKDQNQFIMARGILRCLLAKYIEETPERIEIAYGAWGKPYLLPKKYLYFNVSHSRSYALYAIARTCEVGIDLEFIDKSLDLEYMGSSIFSNSEFTYWKGLDVEDKVKFFFTRWVSKEAFLKALGKGWFEDQEEFALNFKASIKQMRTEDKVSNLYCFDLLPGYASALYVHGDLLRPLYYSWSEEYLESKIALSKREWIGM
ncbi:MAG: 4'-phosphopantetheinyl transferase superfamily protein [Candidatus Paracaedibacteraceae bacterium]|nr:4'-phosphopantetheinyl transferase superfamily protein [Candidatus Paracaedibacteraceae bacterium]